MLSITYFGFPGVKTIDKTVSAEDILRFIEQDYHVSTEQMFSKSRHKNIVDARHMAMYLIRKSTALKLSEIGKMFNSRDHTTVIHACRRIEDLAKIYPDFKFRVNQFLLYHQQKTA